jgi:2-keto-4-pentenoate hydratase
MTFDPAPAAAALLAARGARRPAGPLPAAIAPRDVAEGVAVQFALAGLVGAVPPAGFKIGATTKRMQEYLGVAHPAAGFMRRDNLHASGAALAWSDFRGASNGGIGVECEIAVRLGRDLPFGPCDIERAAAAVGELFAASEVVENRYGKPPAGDVAAVGTPTLIADQFYHGAAVLGVPPADWKKLDLPALPGRISVDGVERASGHGADLLGHPMAALAWLAASEVARAFGGLRAGQVIMLGSVTPPIWLDGPCAVSVAFDGLPEVRLKFS